MKVDDLNTGIRFRLAHHGELTFSQQLALATEVVTLHGKLFWDEYAFCEIHSHVALTSSHACPSCKNLEYKRAREIKRKAAMMATRERRADENVNK